MEERSKCKRGCTNPLSLVMQLMQQFLPHHFHGREKRKRMRRKRGGQTTEEERKMDKGGEEMTKTVKMKMEVTQNTPHPSTFTCMHSQKRERAVERRKGKLREEGEEMKKKKKQREVRSEGVYMSYKGFFSCKRERKRGERERCTMREVITSKIYSKSYILFAF